MKSKYFAGAFVLSISWILHLNSAPWAETFSEFMRGSHDSNIWQLLLHGSSGYVATLPSIASSLTSFLDFTSQNFAINALNCIWLGVVEIGILKGIESRDSENKFWKTANYLFSITIIISLTLHPSLFSITSTAYLGIFPAFIWCFSQLTRLETSNKFEKSYAEISPFVLGPLIVTAISKPAVIVIPIAICIYLISRKLTALPLIGIVSIQFLLSNATQTQSVLNQDSLLVFAKSSVILSWNSLLFATANLYLAGLCVAGLVIAFVIFIRSRKNSTPSLLFFIVCFILSLTPWIAYRENAIALSDTIMKAQYQALTFFVILSAIFILLKSSKSIDSNTSQIIVAGFLVLIIGATLLNQFNGSKSIDARGISLEAQSSFSCKLAAPFPGWDLQISDSIGGSIWSNCSHSQDFSKVVRNSKGEIIGFTPANVVIKARPEWTLSMYPASGAFLGKCLKSDYLSGKVVSETDKFVYVIGHLPDSKFSYDKSCLEFNSEKIRSVGHINFYK